MCVFSHTPSPPRSYHPPSTHPRPLSLAHSLFKMIPEIADQNHHSTGAQNTQHSPTESSSACKNHVYKSVQNYPIVRVACTVRVSVCVCAFYIPVKCLCVLIGSSLSPPPPARHHSSTPFRVKAIFLKAIWPTQIISSLCRSRRRPVTAATTEKYAKSASLHESRLHRLILLRHTK